jgi:hypothetical protein
VPVWIEVLVDNTPSANCRHPDKTKEFPSKILTYDKVSEEASICRSRQIAHISLVSHPSQLEEKLVNSSAVPVAGRSSHTIQFSSSTNLDNAVLGGIEQCLDENKETLSQQSIHSNTRNWCVIYSSLMKKTIKKKSYKTMIMCHHKLWIQTTIFKTDHCLKAAIEDNLEYPCCSKKKNKWEAKVFLYTGPKVITHSFAAKVIIVCCRCV